MRPVKLEGNANHLEQGQRAYDSTDSSSLLHCEPLRPDCWVSSSAGGLISDQITSLADSAASPEAVLLSLAFETFN